MLVCVLFGSDLSESMISSCSGVPCCIIVGWFNGNQLMVDLVAHYKGLLPSSLLEGFPLQGRIQDFKLGGAHIKKVAPSGGRREKFWGISCEKSRFYAKKSYFFQF